MKKIIIKIINKLLSVFIMDDTNKILKKIQKYEYISFDIFDTLIIRKCGNPTNIFDLVEEEYNKKNKHINNFKSVRINAEKKARKESINEEVTIEDIYKYINYDKKTKEKLLKLEEKKEFDECIIKDNIYQIYNYLINNNKKIIITSDIYLKKDLIIKILNKNNINRYEKIYISSYNMKTKKHGSVFKYIKKDLNTNNIIHIGDNTISDYIMPKLNKISSILIRK